MSAIGCGRFILEDGCKHFLQDLQGVDNLFAQGAFYVETLTFDRQALAVDIQVVVLQLDQLVEEGSEACEEN